MTNKNVKNMKILDTRLTIRLSQKERIAAQELIRKKQFKNLSQFTRIAIIELLRKHERN